MLSSVTPETGKESSTWHCMVDNIQKTLIVANRVNYHFLMVESAMPICSGLTSELEENHQRATLPEIPFAGAWASQSPHLSLGGSRHFGLKLLEELLEFEPTASATDKNLWWAAGSARRRSPTSPQVSTVRSPEFRFTRARRRSPTSPPLSTVRSPVFRLARHRYPHSGLGNPFSFSISRAHISQNQPSGRRQTSRPSERAGSSK
jgi:hypothetical protein